MAAVEWSMDGHFGVEQLFAAPVWLNFPIFLLKVKTSACTYGIDQPESQAIDAWFRTAAPAQQA
eukprot:375155-Pelagomonas_calceolata.AAC.4